MDDDDDEDDNNNNNKLGLYCGMTSESRNSGATADVHC
jgi:hypothetical protein